MNSEAEGIEDVVRSAPLCVCLVKVDIERGSDKLIALEDELVKVEDEAEDMEADAAVRC